MLYADNEQISGRQMSRMIFLDLFTTACMIVPKIAVADGAQQRIWPVLSVLFGGLCVIFYAWLLYKVMMRRRGRYDFYTMLNASYGKYAALAVMIYFWLKFVCASIYILRMFQEVIRQTFLTEISGWLTGFLAIITMSYIAGRGIETRGRLCEIVSWVILLPVVLIIVLSMTQMQADQFTVSGHILDAEHLLSSGAYIWTVLGSVEFILFFLPCIRPKQRQIKYILWPAVIACAVAVLVLVACTGVLSAVGMAKEAWPIVTLMQIIRLPGHFVSRQEGLLLSFWMPGALILLSGYVLCAHMIMRKVIKKQYKSWMGIVMSVMIYFLANAIQNYEKFEQIYLKWQFLAGIIPVLVILAGMIIKNKKTVMVCLCLCLSLFLNGCAVNHQIEDRNYVMALGIDYDADQALFNVSMSFPDVGALTGNDGPEPEIPMLIQIKSLDELEAVYENEESQKVDFSQLQVIILGQSILNQPKILKTAAMYMQKHQAFTRTTYICAAEHESSDIIRLDTQVHGSVGIYIKDMIENNHNDEETGILNDLIVAVENSTANITENEMKSKNIEENRKKTDQIIKKVNMVTIGVMDQKPILKKETDE